jgi:4a-hydroxytetrahydrobiopterin dehydratase
MSNLAKQELEACSADTPSVIQEEVKELKKQIPDWHVVEKQGQLQLEKLYKFSDF